jgi:hypothetical protein
MAFTPWESYTPCEWEKSQTCGNKFVGCEFCNQTHDRQGLTIFSDNRIKNHYKPDKALVKRFRESQKK